MSDDDDGTNSWPLPGIVHPPRQSTNAPKKRTKTSDSDDSSSTSPSHAIKLTRRDVASAQHLLSDDSLPRPLSQGLPQGLPSLPPSGVPAFAPRADYVKLAFRETPSNELKLRWLNDVTKAYRLDRELAEVKMSAITSRFVYVSRRRHDIIQGIMGGGFLSLHLDVQDSPDRPRKFPSYLITRYPVDADPSLAKEMPGVYTVRRFLQDGTPINRLVVTWSLQTPPPPTFEFSFLPCLPPCELRRMRDEQPWCFKCWGIGHISRYCSATEKCAWCASAHATRSCPHRPPSTPDAASTSTSAASTSSTTPEPDKSKWKCPRCHQPGVTVWHGCAKRSHAATQLAQAQAPPPPPPVTSPTPPVSDEVIALRKAVATLESRCTALEARFLAMDARVDELVTQGATTAATLSGVVESNRTVITSVTTLTERFEAFASRLEKFGVFSPVKSSSSGATSGSASPRSTSSASRKPKSRAC